jgi:N6-adenosine-specific RNA methylase IME4
MLTWAKDGFATGKWLRGQTEHCLLTIEGHPKIQLKDQSTLIIAKRKEHGRKPDEFYQLVQTFCEEPMLDYFGRESRKDWIVYGTNNQASN